MKLLGTTAVQIEFSPLIWMELGLTRFESYIVVTTISLIMLLVHVSIIEFGVYVLGIKRNGNGKQHIGHKIAHVIHKWGFIGLFIAGVFPWPIIVGVAQPLTYILYCELEKKPWYKPNLGFLSIGLGLAIKMLFFV